VRVAIADADLRVRLVINDFRIALSAAAADGLLVLAGFLDGHNECHRDPATRRQFVHDVVTDVWDRETTVAHTPDAVFALETSCGPELFFVEVDRRLALASRCGRSVSHLLDFYEGYSRSTLPGRYADALRLSAPPEAFHLLLLTSTAERLKEVVHLVRAQRFSRAIESRTWVAPYRSLFADGVAMHAWEVLRRSTAGLGPCTLLDAGGMGSAPHALQRVV
jgi:hypothetical protein